MYIFSIFKTLVQLYQMKRLSNNMELFHYDTKLKF